MATNYPAAFDAFPDQPTLATHLLSTDAHSRLHGDIGDAIRAIEGHLGTAVAPTAGTITYRLDQIGDSIESATSVLTPTNGSDLATVVIGGTSYRQAIPGTLLATDNQGMILPAAPVDKTLVIRTKDVVAFGGTIKTSGTDTFGGDLGGQDANLGFATLYRRQGFLFHYQAAERRWLVFPFMDYEGMAGFYLAEVADPSFSGTSVTAPYYDCTGLAGATTASRWVGTVDGADPSSGTFSVGDYVVDRTLGGFRIYTSAGWRTVAAAGRAGAFRPITATATLDDGDYIVAADSTSGAITVNLPTAVGLAGKEYRIKRTNSGANDVTIDANSSETIDGATTVVLSSQWDVARIVSDGANWLRF